MLFLLLYHVFKKFPVKSNYFYKKRAAYAALHYSIIFDKYFNFFIALLHFIYFF